MTKSELIEFKKKIDLIIEIIKYDQKNTDQNGTVNPLNADTLWYKKESEQMLIKAEELSFWVQKAIGKHH